jgi:hypothetical protein
MHPMQLYCAIPNMLTFLVTHSSVVVRWDNGDRDANVPTRSQRVLCPTSQDSVAVMREMSLLSATDLYNMPPSKQPSRYSGR